jgi:hypothetical protein
MVVTMVISEIRVHQTYCAGMSLTPTPINYEVKLSNSSNELSLVVDAAELDEYPLGGVVQVEVTVQ